MGQGLFSVENLGGPNVPIIIAADGDEAGAVLLQDLSVRLGRGRCKFLTYPLSKKFRGRTRCKDLGEVLEDYGVGGVVKTIERAQWVAVPGVYRLSQLPPRPNPLVYDIGMEHLRNSIRLRMGDFSVWTGIPSHGKTTLVNDIVNRVVQEYSTDTEPVVVTHASFEQQPQIDHRRNLRWWLHKKHPTKQTSAEIENADWWIDEHFRFVVPSEDEDVTLEWLLEQAATSVTRDNAKILAVDPWNEMDHTRLPGESVTDYTGRAIKAFRRLARNMAIHLAVVAHPTKMQQKMDGSFPMPTLYSVSDSAHWYNKADVGTVVHRHGNKTTIWVQKTRYEDEIGRSNVRYDAIYHHGERRYDVLGVAHGDED
jgi:twinkle protein